MTDVDISKEFRRVDILKSVAPAFISALLCEDTARWLKCTPNYSGELFTLSLHEHPTATGEDPSYEICVTKHVLSALSSLYGGILVKRSNEGPPAIQCACAHNLLTLRDHALPRFQAGSADYANVKSIILAKIRP